MELEIWIILLLCLAYFSAGFIDSIAGGGGLISVPALLIASVPPELAIPTNKMASTSGTAASLITYAQKGYVIWKLLIAGLPMAILGGVIGSKLMLLTDSKTLTNIIMLILPLVIIAVLIPKKSNPCATELTPKALYIYNPIICLLIGIYEGFFGPGTGTFYILALSFFLKLNFLNASASAKLFNLSAGLSALAIFLWHGNVIIWLGFPLAVANIAGNITGTKLAIKIGAPLIKKILLVSVSLLMISLAFNP